MAKKKYKVLQSCAGAFGSLGEGDVVDLDADAAEALERVGYVVEVDADGNELPEHEKKVSPPTPSETVSASLSTPVAPKKVSRRKSVTPSKRKTTKGM